MAGAILLEAQRRRCCLLLVEAACFLSGARVRDVRVLQVEVPLMWL